MLFIQSTNKKSVPSGFEEGGGGGGGERLNGVVIEFKVVVLVMLSQTQNAQSVD